MSQSHKSVAEKAFQVLISSEITTKFKFSKNTEYSDYDEFEDGSSMCYLHIPINSDFKAGVEIFAPTEGEAFIQDIFFMYGKGETFETFSCPEENDNILNFVEMLEIKYNKFYK